VTSKRLVAGDTFVFLRYMPFSFLFFIFFFFFFFNMFYEGLILFILFLVLANLLVSYIFHL